MPPDIAKEHSNLNLFIVKKAVGWEDLSSDQKECYHIHYNNPYNAEEKLTLPNDAQQNMIVSKYQLHFLLGRGVKITKIYRGSSSNTFIALIL